MKAKALCVALLGTAFLWSSAVQAWQQLNDSPTGVNAIAPRNESFTASPGVQYLLVSLGALFSYAHASCPGGAVNTAWVAVPKANPNPGGGSDNPAYTDYLNTFTLAMLHRRSVYVYVDGCIDGVPRVIGLTMI